MIPRFQSQWIPRWPAAVSVCLPLSVCLLSVCLYVMMLGATSWHYIDVNTLMAVCGCWPSSQERTAALYVMTLGSKYNSPG